MASPAHKLSKIPPAHHRQTEPSPDATPAQHPSNPHAPESPVTPSPAIQVRADESPQQTDAPPARDAVHNPYHATAPHRHTARQTPQPLRPLVQAAQPPSAHRPLRKPKLPSHASAATHPSSTPATRPEPHPVRISHSPRATSNRHL